MDDYYPLIIAFLTAIFMAVLYVCYTFYVSETIFIDSVHFLQDELL